MKTNFFFFLVLCLTLGVMASFDLNESIVVKSNNLEFSSNSSFESKTPVSIKMYELLEKYSKEFNIPKYVAYNVAFKETRYRGPFHFSYNPHQVSCVGALGPMQIMPSTYNHINNGTFSKDEIMFDIEKNIKTSMKLLNKLYLKYNDWNVVCGCYNTGRPMVNEYGRYCGTNKDYKSEWVDLK